MGIHSESVIFLFGNGMTVDSYEDDEVKVWERTLALIHCQFEFETYIDIRDWN